MAEHCHQPYLSTTLSVAFDVKKPENLTFNTWRFFGADAEWEIPGVPVAKADAIRPVRRSLGVGSVLVMPAKRSSQVLLRSW